MAAQWLCWAIAVAKHPKPQAWELRSKSVTACVSRGHGSALSLALSSSETSDDCGPSGLCVNTQSRLLYISPTEGKSCAVLGCPQWPQSAPALQVATRGKGLNAGQPELDTSTVSGSTNRAVAFRGLSMQARLVSFVWFHRRECTEETQRKLE